jgi:predicted AlkP superfamily pyrophosphatase or phosphodiesterase
MFLTWPPLARHLSAGADAVEEIQIEGDKAPHFARSEVEVAEAAAKFLADDNPDAVFVYFGMVDSMGHTKGFHPQIPEYIQAIEHVDTCLGKVLAALVKRETYDQEDWLIIVTTDHGGRGRNHHAGHQVPEIRNVFLIVSGPAAARGKIAQPTAIVDAPVTALTHLGVTIKPEWKLDGKAVGLAAPE